MFQVQVLMGAQRNYMEIEKDKIIEIAKKHKLKMLLLFGSQASGRVKPDSDFDIAYLPKESFDTKQILELNGDLMDIFHSERIDQVNIRQASPLLLHEISRNSKLLFGQEIDYIRFKTRAFRVFVDSASLFRLQDALIKKRQQFLSERLYA